MSELIFAASTAPLGEVDRIQLGLWSPDDISAAAVCEITSSEIFSSHTGRLQEGGLLDPRMGVVNLRGSAVSPVCTTCGGNIDTCPGHFGYIALKRPVYSIVLLGMVVKTLNCICYTCMMPLVVTKYSQETDAQERIALERMSINRIRNRAQRFRVVHERSEKITQCERCGNDARRYKAEPGCRISYRTRKDAAATIFSAEQAYNMMRRLSNDDIRLLGFHEHLAHPAWMFVVNVPVAPPCVRPPIPNLSGMPYQDDLTYRYMDILQSNAELARKLASGAPPHITDELYYALQYHVANVIIASPSGFPKNIQHKPKRHNTKSSLEQRVKGKHGRVRSNLMGKRVNFSGRSVITGDPNLSINEVGVPLSIAKTLTIPEPITSLNMKAMRALVIAGPFSHPGANYVIRDDGIRLDLSVIRQRELMPLAVGWVVERHIRDGDAVVFNRQPTLHKMSMMCHYVRVMPWSTFRLNLSVTTPYNADFDGDEMNIHVPQSLESRAELEQLMLVERNIVSAQSNKPVMGIVQDALLGARLLSKRDTFLERDEFFNLLMHLPDWDGHVPKPAVLKPRPLWTGKQMFSMFLPQVTLDRRAIGAPDKEENEAFSASDTHVSINRGELVTGILCKNTIGNTAGSLTHVTWNELGTEACRRYLDATQVIVNHWLMNRGFSVGVQDIIADPKIFHSVDELLKVSYSDVQALISEYREGRIELQGGHTMAETFEYKVNTCLNKARDDAGKSVVRSLQLNNAMKEMVLAGSKGSNINIAQMIACVGQQNVEGKRMPFGFRDRTLPHFMHYDITPEARGFVRNSYLSGLNPQEFFFHAMGGREGLIDTAVKTSDTGYMQRRLVKVMEDLTVNYDRTVRNSEGMVVQFRYGEDGADATTMERQQLVTMFKDDAAMHRDYRWRWSALSDLYRWLQPTVADTLNGYIVDLAQEFEQLCDDRDVLRNEVFVHSIHEHQDAWPLPGNIARTIRNACVTFPTAHDEVCDLHPVLDIIRPVRALCEKICRTLYYDAEEQDTAMYMNRMIYCIHVRSMFASRRVVVDLRMNKRSFDMALNEVEHRYMQSFAAPGESVGVVSAQSIGEPTTQMSIVAEERLLLHSDNHGAFTTQIGPWIDGLIASEASHVTKFETSDTTIVDIQHLGITVPAVNTEGVIHWRSVTGITQHPPNGDLVKVTTHTGRTVTATLAKSFLTRRDGRVVPIAGSELKLGDVIPITRMLQPAMAPQSQLHLDQFISKDEAWYGSEVAIARALFSDGKPGDWRRGYNTQYTVPGTLLATYAHIRTDRKRKFEISPDCVYPIQGFNSDTAIPAIFPLTADFGFFIGAYLADGSINHNAIDIAKNDKNFRQRIESWATHYNIPCGTYGDGTDRSISIRIMSTLLTSLVCQWCGQYSQNKYVPNFAYTANDEFILGLIDGYFSGDGTFSRNCIRVSSVSRQLIDGIATLLNRFGIVGRIYIEDTTGQVVQIRSDRQLIRRYATHILRLNVKSTLHFCHLVMLTVSTKREQQIAFMASHMHGDRGLLYDTQGDIFWDPIVSLEIITPTQPYVYDLTVDTDLNFALLNGMHMRDTLNTFHFAGVSAKNVTLGLPRFKQLLNPSLGSAGDRGTGDADSSVSTAPTNAAAAGSAAAVTATAAASATTGSKKQATIKTDDASITVYLTPDVAKDETLAKQVQSAMEYTVLRDIVEIVEIYYDPETLIGTTHIVEDAQMVEDYWAVPDEREQRYRDDERLAAARCNYVIRFVLSHEMMLDKCLRVVDVVNAIYSALDLVSVISSDDNAERLVLHVRLFDCDGSAATRGGNIDETLETYQETMDALLYNLVLKGVTGVRKVYMHKESRITYHPITRAKCDQREWVLSTEGGNLLDVLARPNVDHTRTVTNNVMDVMRTLGIEAARTVQLREMRKCIEFDGTYVNYRHLALLADTMTCRGFLMPVTRQGVTQTQMGAFMRASFETSVPTFFQAAVHAEVDHCRGISQQIMLGKLGQMGTGAFSLYLDGDMLMDAVEQPQVSETDVPLSADTTADMAQMWQSVGDEMDTDAAVARAFEPASPGRWDNVDAAFSPQRYSSPERGHATQATSSPSRTMAYSPSSPAYYTPPSPTYYPSSPAYQPASPTYYPSSPAYQPASPAYQPASPAYQPASPVYYPSSPAYQPVSPALASQVREHTRPVHRHVREDEEVIANAINNGNRTGVGEVPISVNRLYGSRRKSQK